MSNPDSIAFKYNADKNPAGAFFAGVPLRDLTVAEVADLAEPVRESIAAAPFYSRTRAELPKAQAPEAAAEPKGE